MRTNTFISALTTFCTWYFRQFDKILIFFAYFSAAARLARCSCAMTTVDGRERSLRKRSTVECPPRGNLSARQRLVVALALDESFIDFWKKYVFIWKVFFHELSFCVCKWSTDRIRVLFWVLHSYVLSFTFFWSNTSPVLSFTFLFSNASSERTCRHDIVYALILNNSFFPQCLHCKLSRFVVFLPSSRFPSHSTTRRWSTWKRTSNWRIR